MLCKTKLNLSIGNLLSNSTQTGTSHLRLLSILKKYQKHMPSYPILKSVRSMTHMVMLAWMVDIVPKTYFEDLELILKMSLEVVLNRFSSLSLEEEVLNLEVLISEDLGGREVLIWSIIQR